MAHHSPDELWLVVFDHLEDARSLHSTVLSCKKFARLACDAFLRNISWKNPATALANLPFWRRNPNKCRYPRSLLLKLAGTKAPDDFPQIFDYIRSFSRLEHLKVQGGWISNTLYHVLRDLPCLMRVTLDDDCLLDGRPPLFPFSKAFPSPLVPETHILPVTTLSFNKPMTGKNFDSHCLFSYFHNTHTVITEMEGQWLPDHISSQLTSLTFGLSDNMENITQNLQLLHNVISTAPLLQSLCLISRILSPVTISSRDPGASLPVPHLVTFSGPFCASVRIALAHPPALAHFAITGEPVPSTEDALFLLEHLCTSALRRIALLLARWDDRVLLRLVEVLPQCEEIEVIYLNGGPSEVPYSTFAGGPGYSKPPETSSLAGRLYLSSGQRRPRHARCA
ncbi:hypothetical protein DFH06DRAFT_1241229 [Mycena polygramma]|nr:hypothetical protein DFH06DRAFT_1241229 [Mycena polygramma]